MAEQTEAQTPFLDMARALEEGEFLGNADNALIELVTKLKNHQQAVGGKASGTLIVTIKMTDDGKVVELIPKIDLRTPTPVRQRSFMYRTKDNTLSRKHPKQMELPLVAAEDAPAGDGVPTRPALVAQ